MKKHKFSLILFLFLFQTGYGYHFQYIPGSITAFHTKTIITQQLYRNGKHLVIPRVKKELHVKRIPGKTIPEIFMGEILYFKQDSDGDFDKQASREISFSRDRYGKQVILKGKRYFSKIGFPFFSKKNIKIGNSWTADMIETINLRPLDLPGVITYPSSVKYTYAGNVSIDNISYLKITFLFKTKGMYWISNKDSSYKNLVTVNEEGNGVIYWDKQENMPFKISEHYNTLLSFANGQTFLSKGEVATEYVVFSKAYKERETLLKKIKLLVKDSGKLRLARRGVILNFGKILFKTNKTILLVKGIQKLIKITSFLKRNPRITVTIEGHTDNVGRIWYNKRLSRQRAASVYKFFVRQAGISRNRVSYKGFGSDRPIADNGTEEGREKNRRVEIIFSFKK